MFRVIMREKHGYCGADRFVLNNPIRECLFPFFFQGLHFHKSSNSLSAPVEFSRAQPTHHREFQFSLESSSGEGSVIKDGQRLGPVDSTAQIYITEKAFQVNVSYIYIYIYPSPPFRCIYLLSLEIYIAMHN